MGPKEKGRVYVTHFGVSDFVDVLFVSFVFYSLFFLIKQARATFVVFGVVIAGVVYLFVKFVKLTLSATILQTFFAVILIAIVIIFQEELRRFFEQIAVWSLQPKFKRPKSKAPASARNEILAKTIFDLAEDRIGALIVLKGKDPVMRHIHSGFELNGQMSEALIKSIFDPHSLGHDGAVILDGEMVRHFGCHLPLAHHPESLKRKGTRHSAAVGMSEAADVLCIIVSEERGTVSIARQGVLEPIARPEELIRAIEFFQREVTPVKRANIREFITQNWREKALAVLLAAGLWFVVVHESAVVYRDFEVPVQFVGLPSAYQIQRIEPTQVKIVVSGKRRAYYFVSEHDIRLSVKLFDLSSLTPSKKNRYLYSISPTDVSLPADLQIVSFVPRTIGLEILRKTDAKEK